MVIMQIRRQKGKKMSPLTGIMFMITSEIRHFYQYKGHLVYATSVMNTDNFTLLTINNKYIF